MTTRNAPKPEPAYLTLQGCSHRTSLSARTVRREIDSGNLPFYRVSRRRLLVSVADLEAWLEARRIDPTPCKEAC